MPSMPFSYRSAARFELRVDGDVVYESHDEGLLARVARRYARYAAVAIVAAR